MKSRIDSANAAANGGGTASEINVTFIVDGNDADKAVKVLHEEYFGRQK